MLKLSLKSGNKIKCLLCPHYCNLGIGKTGICGVRKNTGEAIEPVTYGIISGCSSDPIEKKPLYHFFPGTKILSIGSYGCNMRCDFCQNYSISQNVIERKIDRIRPEEILNQAISLKNNIGIAYTYNEPVIWYEYVMEVAELIKEAGLYNVMVTNGFVAEEPLKEYLRLIDAFNVDLKAFNNDFYRKIAGADLEPVKNSLKQISAAGRHLEITTLVVTGVNDNAYEMENQVKWISGELGENTPFHLSRYFPMYKRDNPATPHDTLMRLYEIALKHLHYVYVGNTMSATGQDTNCYKCGSLITRRSGYDIQNVNVIEGNCMSCGTKIYNCFTSFSSSK
jgi:pyruvate formate lyase activating enzyme